MPVLGQVDPGPAETKVSFNPGSSFGIHTGHRGFELSRLNAAKDVEGIPDFVECATFAVDGYRYPLCSGECRLDLGQGVGLGR